MPEYIDRDAFIEEQRKRYCEDCVRRKGIKYGQKRVRFIYEIGDAPCRACGMNDVLEELEDYPVADVEKRRYGKNITEEYDPVDQFICSECGVIIEGYDRKEIDEDNGDEAFYEYRFRYCPECGAKVDG